MAKTLADKEVTLIWTLICIFMFFWLSIDIFYSFFDGQTLMMRLSGYLYFDESPVFFTFTVAVKLIVFMYCCFYIYGRLIFYKNKLFNSRKE